MSLISKASREELEVLALHREAALTGVRRRGEEDDVAVGEIAAAGERLEEVVAAGLPGAQLYGEDTENGVDGCGAFFLLLDDPEVYGLPPDPIATTKDLPGMWRAAARAAAAMVVGIAGVVLVAGGRDRR